MDVSRRKLGQFDYAPFTRDPIKYEVYKKHAIKTSYHRPILLVGTRRSGTSTFISQYILNEMFPWWYHCLFQPDGLFLSGVHRPTTLDYWLKNQVSTEEEGNIWEIVPSLLNERYSNQRVRMLLFEKFKEKLPAILSPKRATIVIDQAEELLRVYRADFLVKISDWLDEVYRKGTFRLILVVNSENALNALQLIDKNGMFDIVQTPKVSRDEIVTKYGEGHGKIFDDCDGCIGHFLDYLDFKIYKTVTAKEFTTRTKKCLKHHHSLAEEITMEELQGALDRARKT